MERHERIEELCAAASIGEASGAEVAELQEHFRSCSTCEQIYADFLGLGTVRMLSEATQRPEISGEEAIEYIDSARFREKFLEKAKAVGILCSPESIDTAIPEPSLRPKTSERAKRWIKALQIGLAASVLLAIGLFAFQRTNRRIPNSAQAPKPLAVPQPSTTTQSEIQASKTDSDRLSVENRRLMSETVLLKARLSQVSAALEESKENTSRLENERAGLVVAAKEHEDELEREKIEAENQASALRTQLEGVRGDVAAFQLKIHDLSSQLAEQSTAVAREREMLGADRDIRDLMAARNLHIADVYDTDSRGKTRTAFGRVFFTEGKSLIIYAYDLNDRRVQEAGYRYRVWGKSEGPGHGAKNLGIFYSDDKSQKRWVFKYADPKVLSEIDSVFVTLEPPGKELSAPHGEKLLYAYLRNQANHP